ncbi:MAG: hypothetical protein V4672_18765 [Verrucomicrobiota bacterium]
MTDRLKQPLCNGAIPWLIFCATRTSGETVQAVEELAEAADYEVIWTSTYQTGNEEWQGRLNALKARHLIELLKELAAG